jgi:hypothetical protein
VVISTLRATTAFGTSFDDPSEDDLFDLLSEMNLRGPFVIVERLDREPAGQHFMQVYLNRDESCQVEFRAGSEDRHYQASVPGPFEMAGHFVVARVLQDWAFDRPGWREALSWAAHSGAAGPAS